MKWGYGRRLEMDEGLSILKLALRLALVIG